MRSPLRNTSRGNNSSRRTIASPRPRSTTTLPYSTRLTTPLTMSPMRSLYSWYCRSRPAPRPPRGVTSPVGRPPPRDAAVCERREGVGDDVADLRRRVMPPRVLEADLVGRVLDGLDHQHV